MKKLFSSISLALALSAASPLALAGFIGNEIGVTLPNTVDYAQAVLLSATITGTFNDNGVLIPGPQSPPLLGPLSFIFQDTSIRFTFSSTSSSPLTLNSESFNGPVFTLLSGAPWDILSHSASSFHTFPEEDPGIEDWGNFSVTYGPDHLAIDLGGVQFTSADRIQIDFVFNDATPIPAPATLALWLLGMAGMALARRRRQGVFN